MFSQSRIGALLGALLIILLFTSAAQAESIIRRAAFDIGSANIKCTVADVDIATGEIIEIIGEYSKKVDFAEDMARSYDGNFSREIMDSGMAALKELKAEAHKLEAIQFSAVGGSSFRDARNGRAYFSLLKDETGIPCRILSKQQAALLTYHAVRLDKSLPSRDILVWDIGGAIQTMTARDQDGGLIFYIDKMASIAFKNAIISTIQRKNIATTASPNPMSVSDVDRAQEYIQTHALLNITPELAGRIRSGSLHVIGIGGVHYYAVQELLGGSKPVFTREEVREAVEQWTDKTDEDFNSPYANTRLTNLILVLGYMNAMNMESVTPLKVNQTEGLLVSPEFW